MTKFACRVTQGSSELPEDLELGAVPAVTELPVVGRRAVEPGKVPEGSDAGQPHAVGAGVSGTRRRRRLRQSREWRSCGTAMRLRWRWDSPARRSGAFLHRAFEVLGARPDLAARLPQITGVALSASGLGHLAAAVARFEAWLVEYFKPTSVQREWPLLHVDAAGTVVSGMADLDRAHGGGRVDRGSQVGCDRGSGAGVPQVRVAASGVCGCGCGDRDDGRGCGGALGEEGGGCDAAMSAS